MSKHVLGIDLGTTFSSVSVIVSEKPEIVSDPINRRDIPSMVNFSKKNDNVNVLVGNFAKKNQIRQASMTIYDSKRMLGRKFDDVHIQQLKKKWPFSIEKSETGGILINLKGIEKQYQPYEVSGEILKYLAQIGNSRFPAKERTTDVVITIPANFGEEQRTETMKAAKYAGLNVLQLINEPTAAGLAFGLFNQSSKKQYSFVFDFGGGTLDVSLLRHKGEKIKVKGTDGDMFLGGRDFDENTVNFLVKELKLNDDFLNSSSKMNKLLNSVVEAKIQLSAADAAFVTSEDGDFDDYELSLDKFEEINQKLIDRVLSPVERLLNSAKISKEKIDAIILVGGSSNMRFVKKKLTQFFGKEPYNGVNPEEAVAIGAGIVASKFIEGIDPNCEMKKLKYKDICPISIGTSDIDGTMAVLIRKGTAIPCSKTERFHTVLYRQDTFPVDIYEGENVYIQDNFHLDDFTVYNLPSCEDEIAFDVTFSLDVNNILSASAKLVNGNLSAKKTIKIKRTKPQKNEEIENDENEDFNSNIREIKIFYENIQRFINFNMESFLKVYSKAEIQTFLAEAKSCEDNIFNIELPELTGLINSYANMKFKKYFMHNSIPRFLVAI